MVQSSTILNLIYTIVHRLVHAYRYSMTARGIELAGEGLKRLFGSSAVWRFIKSEERSSLFLEKSFFFRAVRKLLDALLLLLRKFHAHVHPVLKDSLICSAASRVMDNLVVVLCLYVFVFTVMPHNKWHNQYTIVMSAIIALLYLIKASGDGRFDLDIRKLDAALLIFIFAAFIAAITSITVASSMKIFMLYAAPLLIVFIMVNLVKKQEEISLIIYSIIAAVTVASLIGIWQYINHVPVDPLLVDVVMGKGVGRIFSTMGNPNIYAEFLVLTIPFYGAAFFNTRGVKAKIVLAVLTVLPISNLALTYSRAGFLALIITAVVFVFLKNRRWLPVLILAGIVLLPFLPSSIIDRMRHLGKDTSSLYRVEIWKYGLRIIKDYWVTGIGTGSEPFMKLFSNFPVTLIPAHAHMFPLQLWIEFGFAGLLSFAWFAVRIVKKGVSYIFQRTDATLANVLAAGIASLAGILAIGLVEHIWFYPRVMSMFWMITGIFLTVLNLAREKAGSDGRMRGCLGDKQV